MPTANADVIAELYAALGRLDGDAMAACYAPDAHFRDPAFGDLHGPEVGAMWRMLTGRAQGMSVELPEHDADDVTGRAHWIATYQFGPKRRRVVNDIQATYRFADGRIAEHLDDFDLRRWARQAMGGAAGVFGYTPLLRAAIQKGTRKQLDTFMAGEGGDRG